jgi:hypothetical protein
MTVHIGPLMWAQTQEAGGRQKWFADGGIVVSSADAGMIDTAGLYKTLCSNDDTWKRLKPASEARKG